MFKKKRTKNNLLPHQQRLLKQLATDKTHIVFPADKNLGPCIIERDRYITQALKDHLSDETTYQRLSKHDAEHRLGMIQRTVEDFLKRYHDKIDPQQLKYIKRSLVVDDPFPKFYISAKVHKSPWKSRPIVSVSGSYLHGLGRFVAFHLQTY
jgi:hypothetical protein